MSTVLLDTTDLGRGRGDSERELNEDALRRARRRNDPHTCSALGSMTVDDLNYSYDLSFETEPMENIVLCRVRSGGIDQRFPDRQVAKCGPGTVTAVGAREGIPFSGRVFHAHYDALTIERGLLSTVASVTR